MLAPLSFSPPSPSLTNFIRFVLRACEMRSSSAFRSIVRQVFRFPSNEPAEVDGSPSRGAPSKAEVGCSSCSWTLIKEPSFHSHIAPPVIISAASLKLVRERRPSSVPSSALLLAAREGSGVDFRRDRRVFSGWMMTYLKITSVNKPFLAR